MARFRSLEDLKLRLISRGTLFLLLGIMPVFALSQALQIDSLLQVFDQDNTNVSALNESVELLLFSDASTAKEQAEKAILYAKAAGNLNEQIRALRLLTEVNIKMNELELAFENATEIGKLATNGNMDYAMASYNFCDGIINFHLANYVPSIESLFRALKGFDVENYKNEKCKTLNYIGRVYYNQMEYDKAMEYYREALACSKAIQYQMGIAAGLNNIAAVLETKQEYLQAKDYFHQALQMNLEWPNEHWVAINYTNLGVIYGKLGEIEEARAWYNKTVALADQIGFYRMKAVSLTKLGQLHCNQGDLDMATHLFEQSYAFSKEKKLINESINVSKLLHNIYLIQEDTSKAYLYQQDTRFMEEQFFGKEKLSKIYRAELLYNIELEKELQSSKQQRKQLLFVVSILLLSLLSSIIYLFYYRRGVKLDIVEQKARQAATELTLKNKELTTKAMYLAQKNEAITSISKKLSKLRKNIEGQETRKLLGEISRELKRNTNEESWKEFEIYFQAVHPDFYTKLQEQFPTLTKNDTRLCAFLRMNMSSKEIASITGQKISTLEVARSRLRKKLGITNSSISLTSFLANL